MTAFQAALAQRDWERRRVKFLLSELSLLLKFAEDCDELIHHDHGVGPYQEAEEITRARQALVEESKKKETGT